MQGPKEKYNAKTVLNKLEAMIERGCSREIRQVYDDLSIFDWWPERLTITHMKQMRTFLREAIKLGYDGYVCFKVGASGCANGMWAHKEEGKVEDKAFIRQTVMLSTEVSRQIILIGHLRKMISGCQATKTTTRLRLSSNSKRRLRTLSRKRK